MKSLLCSLFLIPLSLAAPVTQRDASPPSFKVGKVIYGGTGCPQGTLDVSISDDGRVLPLNFGRDFAAVVGPNVAPDQSRKNCQLNIQLLFSPGYQYTVYSADYTGYGDLDAGVQGNVKANYYFSGQQNQASSSLGIQGPFTGRYQKHDDVAITVWSPCGQEALFNVNSEVALTPLGASSYGILTADKSSARFTNNLYIRWRQC